MGKERKYRKLFEDFDRLRIMIIGDVMLDTYLWGKVERISPEAPIPIVALKCRENRMGGAANVARNIRSMGATPVLCSVIGTDDKGDQFLELLRQEGIENRGILRSSHRITTTKFRIFGNNVQMLRVDEEVEHDLVEEDQRNLFSAIERILREGDIHCIIFQDYNKGVISASLIRDVVALAGQLKIPMTVDPKKKNFHSYTGVTLFKPNLKELREGLKLEFDAADRGSVIRAAQTIREQLRCRYVMTTLAEKGILMSMDDHGSEPNLFVQAHSRSVADVSGAGDTVISVASLCLALDCTPVEIASISNLAGGLVCEEVGVVPVQKEKLFREVLALL